MNQPNSTPVDSADFDRKALSVAGLVVFLVSFFLPFVVNSDPGVIGAIFGFGLSFCFALMSRKRLLSRIVLIGLGIVAVIACVNFAIFMHAGR